MSNKLMKLLPKVKRARDFYLYDENSDRILDLYLDKGRAISGHRPNGLSLAIKNSISRGLYAPYPSIYSGRLITLLKNEFPGFNQWEVYKSLDSFSSSYSGDLKLEDPVYGDDSSKQKIWRPYLPIEDNCELLVLSFPFPGSDVVAVLSKEAVELPASDDISTYILSGLIRSFYDLKKRMEQIDENKWSVLDETSHWNRKGPYLVPDCKEDEYGKLFKLYLDSNILISPEFGNPSICAVDIKEGTLKKLFNNIREIESGK